MHQCPQCGSYNDGQAAFCNQCGGRLRARGRSSGRTSRIGSTRARSVRSASPGDARHGGGRRVVGFLVLAVLLALLAGVIIVSRPSEEEAPTVARERAAPVESEVSEAPAAVDDAPAPVTTRVAPSPEPPENVPTGAELRQRVNALVSRALVVLELRDDRERPMEQRGVLIHESGVVLCRFESLIGARGGTARLLTEERVRTDILGLSFRDEASDLALVRLAPLENPFPSVPLISAARLDAADDGDQLFVFNDYRAIPAVIQTRDHVGPDGVRRTLLGEPAGGVKFPPQVFLAVDPKAAVFGLCRPEEPASPDPEPGGDSFRISVDEAAWLSESLLLPVGVTLEELTERLYTGTFADLFARGTRAYRERQWKAAIELLEGALERVALDEPPEKDVEQVHTALREAYLQELDRLSKARRYREATELGESAVARYEDGPVLWRLLGEARLALDQHVGGIAALLESRALEPSRGIDEALEEAYLELAAGYSRSGEDRLAEVSLLEGIEAVPRSGELRIELAKLYVRFQAYDDAVRLLDEARDLDSRFGDVIDVLLARIDEALKPRDSVVIPMSSSNSIRAQAVVDGSQEVEFIVDTGASLTAIPANVATALGYNVDRAPRIRANTANGVVEVPVIQVQSINLGGYTVRNIRVMVLQNVALLGLNFLNHFKYTVDAQRREFRLERP